jgi:hypothetical protein
MGREKLVGRLIELVVERCHVEACQMQPADEKREVRVPFSISLLIVILIPTQRVHGRRDED